MSNPIIKGAREHNLKNLDREILRERVCTRQEIPRCLLS